MIQSLENLVTDGQTDRQTERQTDRQTDKQTDRQTDDNDFIGRCPTNVNRPKISFLVLKSGFMIA